MSLAITEPVIVGTPPPKFIVPLGAYNVPLIVFWFEELILSVIALLELDCEYKATVFEELFSLSPPPPMEMVPVAKSVPFMSVPHPPGYRLTLPSKYHVPSPSVTSLPLTEKVLVLVSYCQSKDPFHWLGNMLCQLLGVT